MKICPEHSDSVVHYNTPECPLCEMLTVALNARERIYRATLHSDCLCNDCTQSWTMSKGEGDPDSLITARRGNVYRETGRRTK